MRSLPALIFPIFLSLPVMVLSQKLRKDDKLIISNLHTAIYFLNDEKLAGSETGSAGEKMAAAYIASGFEKLALKPKGDNGRWSQGFDIYDGREIVNGKFFINGSELMLNQEYFPLSFSASGKVEGSPAMALQESGVPWFIDLKDIFEANQNDPLFSLENTLRDRVRDCKKKGASAVIFYNSSKKPATVLFNAMDSSESEKLVVLYITPQGRKKYLKDESMSMDVKMDIGIISKKRQGQNVIGYIDNGAPYTVVIGANYTERGDHFTDQASGTAALMELARMLKESRSLKSNYLFVAFSGANPDFPGSQYFMGRSPVAISRISYMVGLDPIGMFSDSSRLLTVCGYETAAEWPSLLKSHFSRDRYVLGLDSCNQCAGDHISFYNKQIPVLFFQTAGAGKYLHSADADGINYRGELQIIKSVYAILMEMDGRNKPVFRKSAQIH